MRILAWIFGIVVLLGFALTDNLLSGIVLAGMAVGWAVPYVLGAFILCAVLRCLGR